MNVKAFDALENLCDNLLEIYILSKLALYTMYGAGYYAGISALAKNARVCDRTVKKALSSLRKKGLIYTDKRLPGRSTSTYKVTEVVLACMKGANFTSETGQNMPRGSAENAPEKDNTGTNTPLNPPKGDRERKHRTSVSRVKNRAHDYMHGNEKYDAESLRKLGISQGEEFYDDDDDSE